MSQAKGVQIGSPRLPPVLVPGLTPPLGKHRELAPR